MDVPSDSHTLLHLIHEVNEQTSRRNNTLSLFIARK